MEARMLLLLLLLLSEVIPIPEEDAKRNGRKVRCGCLDNDKNGDKEDDLLANADAQRAVTMTLRQAHKSTTRLETTGVDLLEKMMPRMKPMKHELRS
mmetsp:Transcript_6182/g.11018  ORF Transcript_6182/g.11018 Transcript_6182/m.11018 type:complete len:97 (-) Transcript_6182:100-390(-)